MIRGPRLESDPTTSGPPIRLTSERFPGRVQLCIRKVEPHIHRSCRSQLKSDSHIFVCWPRALPLPGERLFCPWLERLGATAVTASSSPPIMIDNVAFFCSDVTHQRQVHQSTQRLFDSPIPQFQLQETVLKSSCRR